MTRPDTTAPEQVIGSPDEAARARQEAADAAARRLAGEITVLENFERRLNRQIHEKQESGHDDYVRELIQRRISVRARLEEMRMRQARTASDRP
jgi:hypothetical protein